MPASAVHREDTRSTTLKNLGAMIKEKQNKLPAKDVLGVLWFEAPPFGNTERAKRRLAKQDVPGVFGGAFFGASPD